MQEDLRDIPVDLQPYLTSPPRPIIPLSLDLGDGLALTNEWFSGKWSFVYFTHSQCIPDCQLPLEYMNNLQLAFSSNDFNFLAIDIDGKHESAPDLARFLAAHQYKLTAASAGEAKVESLAKTFVALYLRTDFTDGTYQIEQEHHIFVVDPKGRLYATFIPPYSSASIQEIFLRLRSFYAKSE